MAKNHQSLFIVGAMGILVGVMVGANSSQNAQTVSYSGMNPTRAQNMQDIRNDIDFRNSRSNNYGIELNYDRHDLNYLAEQRREERIHSAAPAPTLRRAGHTRGIRTTIDIPMECAYYDQETDKYIPYSRTRLIRCMNAVQDDAEVDNDHYIFE